MRKVLRVVNHPMSRRLRKDVASALALELFSKLEGDLPRKQLESLRNGDFLSVVSAEVDPSTFTDAGEFADAYLAAELMSKFPDWELGIDKTAVAYQKFIDSEELCAATNLRFVERRSYVNGLYSPYTPESIISVAREKIRRVLGPFSWDLAERHFGFGPGATSNVRSRFGDAYFKYKAKPWTTRGNAVLAHTCISRVPAWFDHVAHLCGETRQGMLDLPVSLQIEKMFQFTDGNSVITVPKNAKTERVIAIEPTMNGYVQHGIGGLIRSRLRRVGIDLNDQSRNQELALEGSRTGLLATIDLSSASDTISLEVCRELLPDDWFSAIKQARSPVGVLPDGTRLVYQKVSSMGCGFTFELESLLFWALCSSVASHFMPIDRRLSVYGDDIIVPTSISHQVIWILNYCGFTCNMKKTFVTGAFRESCGKHYFRGVDVSPIYIRKDVTSPESLIVFCNQVRRYARLSWGLDSRFLSTYALGVSFLPSALRRPSISDGYGDAALIGDFDEVSPSKAYPIRTGSRKLGNPQGFEGYIGHCHVRLCETRQYSDVPYLVRQLDGVDRLPRSLEEQLSSRSIYGWKRGKLVFLEPSGVPILDSQAKWRSVKIVIPLWQNYGPWF